MKPKTKRILTWVLPVAVVGLLFLFFFRQVPYHLFHKEQTHLFLCNAGFVADYFCRPAALARLAGDYLTQYYYYIAAGPLILALVLTLWGTVLFRLFRPWLHGWAWVVALAAMVWEGGRQCALAYPLWSTLSLTGAACVLLACRPVCRRMGRRWCLPLCLLMLAGGYWLFGCGEWTILWHRPDSRREYLLALDSETYFGNRNRLGRLLDREDPCSATVTYFRNLYHSGATSGTSFRPVANGLPDRLLDAYQPFQHGLFLPVSSQSDYIRIYSANELWFALGDMTMAEHAAMLGMIFSPRHTGTRALRRLAEINLINGDEAAALKYLRLLGQTSCHRRWAEEHWPGKQTPAVQRRIAESRRHLPVADTLRSSADAPASLRLLLQGSEPHPATLDYLLCYDLLVKDIDAFVRDYRTYAVGRPLCRLYAEAWLVWMAGRSDAAHEGWMPERLPASVVEDFRDYSRLYETHQGDGRFLQAKYGKTYWFYFHYATRGGEKGGES